MAPRALWWANANVYEYRRAVEPGHTALRMIREAIGELFGPLASLESEEAVLLRGPSLTDDAEAIIEALQRVRERTCPSQSAIARPKA